MGKHPPVKLSNEEVELIDEIQEHINELESKDLDLASQIDDN